MSNAAQIPPRANTELPRPDPLARRRRAGLALASVALALNVTALIVPFLSIHVVLSGTDLYSLPRSVNLLWEAGLHVLALLVVAFSIVFPFVKLAVVIHAGLRGGDAAGRQRRLERVGRLGRWSMLDVFLAAILLGLTNDRFFVDTQAEIGLPLFAVAIALALVAGEVLEGEHTLRAPRPRRRATRGERALLAVTWAFLLLAIVLPFLQIADWRLQDDAYSVGSLVVSLWSASPTVSLILAVTLVLVPLAELAAMTVAALGHGASIPRAAALRRQLERWSMLEVFVLALAIFLVEGSEFVATELHWGSLLLLAAIGLYTVCRSLLERRLTRPRLVPTPLQADA